jgi:hypothetical protein
LNSRDEDIWSDVIDFTTAIMTYGPVIVVFAKYMRGDKLTINDYASLIPFMIRMGNKL